MPPTRIPGAAPAPFGESPRPVTWQSAALTWGSQKQKRVALSSCEAEIIALSEAAKDVVYFRKLLTGLDPSAVDGPTLLYTDAKAAQEY